MWQVEKHAYEQALSPILEHVQGTDPNNSQQQPQHDDASVPGGAGEGKQPDDAAPAPRGPTSPGRSEQHADAGDTAATLEDQDQDADACFDPGSEHASGILSLLDHFFIHRSSGRCVGTKTPR
jgi:hypothetical protein